MKRCFRLTRSIDFQRVRRSGRSYAHPLLVLIISENHEINGVRIGISASHAVGNAVVRNRAKRRIRASAAQFVEKLKPGSELIFLARAPIREAGFEEIQNAMNNLLQRAGIISKE